MILGHCHGEDYSNPANELCGQALNTFNDVRTLDVYLLLIYGDCEFLYVLNLCEMERSCCSSVLKPWLPALPLYL